MICVSCGQVEGGKRSQVRPCSQCGAPLQRESRDSVRLAAEALATARVRELVRQWADEGLIERHSQLRILDRLEPARSERAAAEAEKKEAERAAAERETAWIAAERARVAAERARVAAEAEQARMAAELAAPPSAREPELPRGAEVLAIGALAALDAEVPVARPGRWATEVRPLLYENVGWFIGTILVLAGSIYGVREAWRTLGGVARHVSVGGALFAYHAVFVGLAAVLAKKSAVTGKVLASIALGLLPIVFVALSSSLQVSVPTGLLVGLVFAAGALFTTGSIARRLDAPSPLGFSLLLVPALVAELPLAVTAPDAWGRVGLPFVGVACLAVTTRGRSLSTALSVGYAAIALGVYALVGGPDDAARGAVAAAGFGLFGASLAATVLAGADRDEIRAEHPRAASLTVIFALVVILVAALRASGSIFAGIGAPADVLFAHALTAIVATGAFAWVGRARRAGLHFAAIFAPIAGFLLARAIAPERPETWTLGAAVTVSAAFVFARRLDDRRAPVVAWNVLAALAAMVAAPFLDRSGLRFTLLTALTISVGAHLGADARRRGLHYLGGVAAVTAALTWVIPTAIDAARASERVLLGAAVAFALAAFAFDRRLTAAGERDDARPRPFDDLSSAALWCALLVGATRLTVPRAFSLDAQALATQLVERPVVALVGVAFVARSVRDRTAWGAFLGALTLGALSLALAGARSAGNAAYVSAIVALALAVAANVRFAAPDAPAPTQRHLFGKVPLPFPASGARAIGDGLARASWVATALSLLLVVSWIGNRVEADRPLVVMAGALLVITQLVGFLTPAFEVWGMRGSVAALSLATAFVGVAAIANRIGRPLPPPVVGIKLSLVALATWGVAQLARKKGPALGRALGNEQAGGRYHVVFHAVVVILSFVLAIDAVVIAGGSITQGLTAIPPTMLLGAAVSFALLSWSLRSPWLLHLAAPLAIGGAALVTTQRTAIGAAPPLVLGDALAWGRALLGPAVCGVLLSVAAGLARRRDERWTTPLAVWTAIVAGLVIASSWFRAEILAATLIATSGVVLLLADRPRTGRVVATAGAVLVLHAAAQGAPTFPAWTGPAIAAIGALTLLAARTRDVRPVHQELLQDLFAAAAFLVAFGYAFAESGRPDPVRAGASVLAAALDGLDVRWVVLSAPATTAAIAGAALAAAGVRARGVARSVVMHLAGAALLAGAAVAGTFLLDRLVDPAQWRAAPAVVGRATAGDLSTWLLRRLGPTIACVLAVVASFHHVAAVLVGLQGRREDGARPDLGARLGRDLLLVASATAGVAFVLAGRAPGALSPARTAIATGFGAIVVATATAAHAAFRERSARHVYFVQLALVATYALFRNELAPGLPPEADATFALVLGFLLLGATVQARRADIPEIAASTRTFAALLPIAVAVFMPHRASMSAALAAAASAALYGALGWVERSRWLGTLGVAAINLALLLVARTGGLQGREFDLAAIGLFILAVGHLFTTKMEHGARVAVRVVGGLFLYSPAALRLATQLGDAPSGAYSVGFGAACLLGVLAGMVLHIRAYLAFGTLFLVLDVVANLAAAGLRDHRIGFLVLSVTGLSILAIMVVVTLKRDRVRALSARLRASLRGWD